MSYLVQHGVPVSLVEFDRWLQAFLKRYFGVAQFERTATPVGPKVARRIALPAWRLARPSDSTARAWLDELG